MTIVHTIIQVPTGDRLGIYNLTAKVQAFVTKSAVWNGSVLVFSRHTTTALAINEYEERLLEDIKAHLYKLAPDGDRYLHNDLHLRDVPADEPENAHSHLMAMMLHNHEMIPVVDGQLALGTYQSLLFLELDGPRDRTLFLQVSGEPQSS